jgi:phosphohistidine phosphatase
MRDEDRTLTEAGAKKMLQTAEGLHRLGFVPKLLLSSPLIRALQTAEILVQVFGKDVKMKTAAYLAPAGNHRELHREILRCENRLESLMIVGHQPSLGEIAGEIVCGSPECRIDMKKGGICVIETESAEGSLRGRLIALLTPSILRKMGSVSGVEPR